MPRYEYDCPRCGSFEEFRPIAEYELPAACPSCGAESPRAVASFPMISMGTLATGRGNAARANRLSAISGHGPGCRCCGALKIPRAEWTSKLL
jgi:putative FmdB family regulatory protein